MRRSFFPIYGSHEGLYGLGQHQAGVWNYRGETVDLSQENTKIAIPLLVSTNGYGIFWNNPSRSRREQPLRALRSTSAPKLPTALTTTSSTDRSRTRSSGAIAN